MLEVVERSSPGGIVMVCDDVRQETNGKLIHIGVYINNEIVFPYGTNFPAFLHKLCIIMRYYENKETFPSYEKIEVLFPGDEDPTIVQDIPPKDIPASVARNIHKLPFLGFDAMATMSPIMFKQPGEVKVFASNSKFRLRLGSFTVRVVTSEELAPLASPVT